MKKRLALAALLLCLMLLAAACSAKGAAYDTAAPMEYAEAPAAAAPMAMEEAGYSVSNAASKTSAARGNTDAGASAGDYDVRKIIYNADMGVTADDPAAALASIVSQAEALGGYVADSYTTNDDYGASRCSATLKVPADRLSELVEAAKATGKVDDYQLSSDDISQAYYDIEARLKSAKAEEQTLLSILDQCTSVEEVLAVRESLASVRADIESYQGQINLWDNLVSYATLTLSIWRTPRTPVENENELVEIWKASDVWKRMSRGFANSARFTVNAVGAIGIFLAVAAIPAGILFLCIGLPIILRRKKKKKRKAAEAAAAAAAETAAATTAPEASETTKQNE